MRKKNISEGDKGELQKEIASLVTMEEKDEYAKRFDNFMYGLMLISLEQTHSFKNARRQLDAAYDFEDYREKVNRYVREHGNTISIHKLTHNIPLTEGDYRELERILTNELGTKEDYVREYGDTPFGLLIRKIGKMDHEAAMQAFSAFINDASLNPGQIAFVKKIINYIELNGYMENVSELTRPPFDKPISFMKLFDAKTRAALMQTIHLIKDNATNVVA